jgi:hypothetical protein
MIWSQCNFILAQGGSDSKCQGPLYVRRPTTLRRSVYMPNWTLASKDACSLIRSRYEDLWEELDCQKPQGEEKCIDKDQARCLCQGAIQLVTVLMQDQIKR